MGKLLQKVVHGILPSWLIKVKSSSQSSSKKLLPFLRVGGNHPSSNTSPSSPPTTSPVPALVDNSSTQQDASSSIAIPPPSVVNKNHTQQDETRKSLAILPSSSSVQRQESESEESLERGDVGRHQHEECHVSEDVKVHRKFRDMLEDSILITQSNRRNTKLAAEQYAHSSDESHQHEECHVSDDVKLNRKFRDMLKDDVLITQSDPRNTKLAAEQYAHSSEESLKMQGVLQHMEENIHHSQDGVQEAQYDNQYQEKAYQEMWGRKRKNGFPKLEEDEEGEEEEGGAESDGIKRRAWKRRKREKGVMSCELPESICRIVGNGRAVVKQSVEPHLALWESMVEMIVGNGLWEVGNLEFLLYCYLSLNEPHLHPIIQSSFLQVLKDLERIS